MCACVESFPMNGAPDEKATAAAACAAAAAAAALCAAAVAVEVSSAAGIGAAAVTKVQDAIANAKQQQEHAMVDLWASTLHLLGKSECGRKWLKLITDIMTSNEPDEAASASYDDVDDIARNSGRITEIRLHLAPQQPSFKFQVNQMKAILMCDVCVLCACIMTLYLSIRS